MYKKIKASINGPLTSFQVYKLFQPYVALAKMGHCTLDYTGNEYENYVLQQGGTVFPLNLFFLQDQVFVKDNFSDKSQIAIGDEILAVNETPMKEVMAGIYNFISGESDYHKNSAIDRGVFARYFWFFYGTYDVFDVRIKKVDGREITLQVPAISGYDFERQIADSQIVINTKREYRFINDIAYLHPGAFFETQESDNMMNQETLDSIEFYKFIDSAFSAFHEKGAKTLIIDLRNNPGGDNSFSDYMIAYFASKPFCFCSEFKVKTSQTTKDFFKDIDIPSAQELKKEILSRKNGTRFEVSMPKNQPHADATRFTGNVYVLVNRYSYSNATSVAAIIQDYRFGIIIGEETPDLPTAHCATHQFKLPNTQLLVTYPKAFMIRPNGDISPRGVIPDYSMEDNIFTDTDEVLEYAIQLINNKN
jgi:C-terminal processing protease CtpA/Prc